MIVILLFTLGFADSRCEESDGAGADNQDVFALHADQIDGVVGDAFKCKM